MTQKEKLISHLKEEKREELIPIIQNHLEDDEVNFAIEYIEKLNTISTHLITKIEKNGDGVFSVNSETGLQYIR